MANSADKHSLLKHAHIGEIAESTAPVTVSEQEFIDWLEAEDKPVDEGATGSYVFEDTDPGLNVLRLDLDPDGQIPRTTEEELSRLVGFSSTYIPNGRRRRDLRQIVDSPAVDPISPFGETTIANLEWEM